MIVPSPAELEIKNLVNDMKILFSPEFSGHVFIGLSEQYFDCVGLADRIATVMHYIYNKVKKRAFTDQLWSLNLPD